MHGNRRLNQLETEIILFSYTRMITDHLRKNHVLKTVFRRLCGPNTGDIIIRQQYIVSRIKILSDRLLIFDKRLQVPILAP